MLNQGVAQKLRENLHKNILYKKTRKERTNRKNVGYGFLFDKLQVITQKVELSQTAINFFKNIIYIFSLWINLPVKFI